MIDREIDMSIYDETKKVVSEVIEKSNLKKGDVLVVGCSTSAVLGDEIGTNSSMDTAKEIFDAIYDETNSKGIFVAAQCCEHLNRTIIVEKELLTKPIDGFTKDRFGESVTVVPQSKAGGSLATNAWAKFSEPVAIESIQAEAGMDIGGTLIGMHLKRVAVPLKLENKKIGEANVIAAGHRPKFVGGERAKYE